MIGDRLKIKAYKTRYDFDKITIKDRLLYGHYDLSKGAHIGPKGQGYSKTVMCHLDDVTLHELKNGVINVLDMHGAIVHAFGPKGTRTK